MDQVDKLRIIELCNEQKTQITMAEIIKTDGTRQSYEPANGTDFTLEEMQKAVGGMVEIIELDDKQSMILNEDGKLLGFPYNEVADNIFHDHFVTLDYIVGDVLICNNKQIR